MANALIQKKIRNQALKQLSRVVACFLELFSLFSSRPAYGFEFYTQQYIRMK